MSIQDDMFNYVMKTPENTNPAVLKSLINKTVQLPIFNLKGIEGYSIENINLHLENGGFIDVYNGTITISNQIRYAKYLIPIYNTDSTGVTYSCGFSIQAPKRGAYNVTVNGQPVALDNGWYTYLYSSHTYPTIFNVEVAWVVG